MESEEPKKEEFMESRYRDRRIFHICPLLHVTGLAVFNTCLLERRWERETGTGREAVSERESEIDGDCE